MPLASNANERFATMRSGSPSSILPAVKSREQNILETAHPNKRRPSTTCAVAPLADSRAHLFGASSRAS